jgi:hypothetical protein
MAVDPVQNGYALLYSTLHTDSTFMGLVSGIYRYAAAAGTVPDFCIIALQSATDTNSGTGVRLLNRALFQVKISGPVADAANIAAAYARADALLQPSGNPLRNTDNTLACFREQALDYGEVRQDGTLWMHHGGLYRVEV